MKSNKENWILKENSWHLKMNQFVFGPDYIMYNLCPYFWKSVIITRFFHYVFTILTISRGVALFIKYINKLKHQKLINKLNDHLVNLETYSIKKFIRVSKKYYNAGILELSDYDVLNIYINANYDKLYNYYKPQLYNWGYIDEDTKKRDYIWQIRGLLSTNIKRDSYFIIYASKIIDYIAPKISKLNAALARGFTFT
jgi:hypothetical protein